MLRLLLRAARAGVPVSPARVPADLLEALKAGVAGCSAEEFYYLRATALVKDERHFDRFDRVFAEHFAGAEAAAFDIARADPARTGCVQAGGALLSEEESAQIERSAAGTSCWRRCAAPRGAEGTPPGRQQVDRHRRHLALRRGRLQPRRHAHRPGGARSRRAVKVWEQREFRNFDDSVELGTRNIKLALRRCGASRARAPPRNSTSTAPSTRPRATPAARHQAGAGAAQRREGAAVPRRRRLDGRPRPRLRGTVLGARSEFKHLEHYYFHNFIYESVWKDNRRRHSERTPTEKVLRTYNADYKRDLRRRRDHEPLRDRAAGRQRRALERGGRRDLDVP
jgi:uncharacterized protein with von Willebrand factor type A (vWA) domain